MRRLIGRAVLAATGLHAIHPARPDAATETAYRAYTEAHVDRAAGAAVPAPPGPLMAYLDWLAGHRDVVFHGSKTDGVDELRTERTTHDVEAFGDQPAVYASDAPLWALAFAVMQRGPAWRGTMNGCLSATGDRDLRGYVAVDTDAPAGAERGPGWLYVLPRTSFTAQPPWYGVIDRHHLVSLTPVRPVARFTVAADDFPLPIVRYRAGDSMWRVIRRSAAAQRAGIRGGEPAGIAVGDQQRDGAEQTE